MKRKLSLEILCLLGFLILLESCAKDGDFNSEETLPSSQIIESDLLISNFDTSNFIDSAIHNEVLLRTDTTRVELISSNYFMGHLKKVNLTFNFKNSIDKSFKVNFDFLDDNNVLKHSVQVPVSHGSIETPITVETTVSFEEPELSMFMEATKVVYKITQDTNSPILTTRTGGSIALQSKAFLHFDK